MSDETIKNLNVDEVLEAIKNGVITAEQAFEYENQGKKRKTLLEELEEMIGSGNKVKQETDEKAETETVVLISNIKLGKKRFKTGEKVEVSTEDYDVLLKAGLIQKGY